MNPSFFVWSLFLFCVAESLPDIAWRYERRMPSFHSLPANDLALLRYGKRSPSLYDLLTPNSNVMDEDDDDDVTASLREELGYRQQPAQRRRRSVSEDDVEVDSVEHVDVQAHTPLKRSARAVSMLRMGRAGEKEDEKKAVSMLRMGRAGEKKKKKRKR